MLPSEEGPRIEGTCVTHFLNWAGRGGVTLKRGGDKGRRGVGKTLPRKPYEDG